MLSNGESVSTSPKKEKKSKEGGGGGGSPSRKAGVNGSVTAAGNTGFLRAARAGNMDKMKEFMKGKVGNMDEMVFMKGRDSNMDKMKELLKGRNNNMDKMDLNANCFNRDTHLFFYKHV